LAGEGLETILFLDPAVTTERTGTTIVNAAEDLHDVTLRDFLVEGAIAVHAVSINSNVDYTYTSGSGSDAITIRPTRRDPNQDRRQRSSQLSPSRAGIVFSAQHDGQMRNLRLEHVTVRDCTHNGVAIRGAANISILACDFSDNGSSVVPGPGLQHNLLLAHVAGCNVQDSRFDSSLWGSGLDVSFGNNVTIADNELARNTRCGIYVTESCDVHIRGNLTEGNDSDGIAIVALAGGCREIELFGNVARNNGRYGIEVDHVLGGSVERNSASDNGAARQITVSNSHSIKH
jgi:parallel beta-helix repeat protein